MNSGENFAGMVAPVKVDVRGLDVIRQMKILRHLWGEISKHRPIEKIRHADPEQQRKDDPAHMAAGRNLRASLFWYHRCHSSNHICALRNFVTAFLSFHGAVAVGHYFPINSRRSSTIVDSSLLFNLQSGFQAGPRWRFLRQCCFDGRDHHDGQCESLLTSLSAASFLPGLTHVDS